MKKFALIILGFWLLAVLLGYAVNLQPNHINLNAILAAPNAQHWLGADDLGRDILARVLKGVEVSLIVSLIVTAITMTIGVTIGLLAGFLGGKTDQILMQITDVFLAFPGILLAIAFAAVLGAGLGNLIAEIGRAHV